MAWSDSFDPDRPIGPRVDVPPRTGRKRGDSVVVLGGERLRFHLLAGGRETSPHRTAAADPDRMAGVGRAGRELEAELGRDDLSVTHLCALPPALRHLYRLTGSFRLHGEIIPFIHIYARPEHSGNARRLEFIRAQESGDEGISCVDDVARAAILALQLHESTFAPPALALARQWLRFVIYMQEPDGRFSNFIKDETGARNTTGVTSYTGGEWWTARAMWALATAWRVTRDPEYLRHFRLGSLAPTTNLKVLALQALALMELYEARPDLKTARQAWQRCETICSAAGEYFRDTAGQDEVELWGYHQLHAVARAGRLFSRLDFLRACQQTVDALVEPVITDGFFHAFPTMPDPQCAYDIAPITLGLEELSRSCQPRRYRALAFACAAWLDGNNPAGKAPYDRRTGRCADGVHQDEMSQNCGAESAIEAGFMELARCRLQQH